MSKVSVYSQAKLSLLELYNFLTLNQLIADTAIHKKCECKVCEARMVESAVYETIVQKMQTLFAGMIDFPER